MDRVADCMIRRVVPQATKWQRIGDQIDACSIAAKARRPLGDMRFIFSPNVSRAGRVSALITLSLISVSHWTTPLNFEELMNTSHPTLFYVSK